MALPRATEPARRGVRVIIPLFSTVLSAVLYGLCFPPARWQALAWLAEVPFLIAIRRTSLRTALVLAWVFTVTVAYTVGDWFPRAVADYYAQPQIVGIGFFFGVSSIMAAPYVMGFAVIYRRLTRLPGSVRPLLAGAAWVAAELGRVELLTGNPWAVFGYSQAGVAALVQIADITGVYGVSFVLVAVNAALAEIVLGTGQTRRRQAGIGLVLTGVVVACVVGYGQLRLRTVSRISNAARPVPVAIIQGNLDIGSQWRSDFYGRNLDVYLRLTNEALTRSHPDLVFWPESAMTFFLEQEPLYQRAIARVMYPGGAELVAGGPRSVRPSEPIYYNSVFLLSPEGQVLGLYDKQHLLPFAEYFPFHRLDFLRRRFERVREFSPGGPTPPLTTKAGRAGILICNEGMFPEPAAARVSAGADYLVNPSNDSWLGDRKFSEQQFDIISFRAIEQRRYLVRTSTAGPSAIIDPTGHTMVRAEPFTQGWVAGTVRASNAWTPYHRIGDLFAVACTVLVAFVVLKDVWEEITKRGT
jgi:apolipoprotein N-acyltransferase